MRFSKQKHGYSMNEVDNYIASITYNYENQLAGQKERINNLLEENERLKRDLKTLTDKESNINSALLIAVDKAKQIEEGSRKVYELEIQRLKLLFNKYRDFLDKLIEDNPNAKDIATTKEVVDDFKREINQAISKNFSGQIKDVSAYDPMRNLLDKMNKYISRRNKGEKVSYIQQEFVETRAYERVEPQRHYTPAKIKPIVDVQLDSGDKFENLVDKFLEVGESEEKNAFAQQIMKSNGFDLREAVNPTEDLEDIMKFFDFYEGD